MVPRTRFPAKRRRWPQKLSKATADGERSCTTLTLVNRRLASRTKREPILELDPITPQYGQSIQAIDLFRVKRKVNALKHKRTAIKRVQTQRGST
ncbi:hypothetical protein EVAR_75572_1 [Eumeta japonica]|uniref:Uncharacterized protein n=1 Tax=Eumeta variegata TaxID=151549 RepID=A0A4C1UJT6_EUMVA|nr:hypothetical protein EVAR_75572_1 [Eumeta japonica]